MQKSRGMYRCKKCGQLKKGHVCKFDQQAGASKGEVRQRGGVFVVRTVAGERNDDVTMTERIISNEFRMNS